MALVVEILDVSLDVITPVRALKPFDNNGTILQFSKELSDYGSCRFRISAYDDMFDNYDDILKPHEYHVRIREGDTVVWQGAITANPKRNKSFIEVVANEYEFYLGKKLVHRTSPDINGTSDIYRIFKTGTMSTAVTAIMNETIADYAASTHVLKNMTLGTIENPDYPPGMTSDYDAKTALKGAWSFGEGTKAKPGPTLQFDYHNILYILKAFGMYTYSDFKIDKDLKFNFKKFYGNNLLKDLVFSFGEQGNIIDYNLPRLGQGQVNSLTAIATDPNGVILHKNLTDDASIKKYGLMQDVAAYADVKSQSCLNARATAELPLVATPDETNAIVYLNENGFPLGMYDIGDLITVKVKNKGIDFNQIRRIVGITVLLNETGRLSTAIQTNIPRDWQYTT